MAIGGEGCCLARLVDPCAVAHSRGLLGPERGAILRRDRAELGRSVTVTSFWLAQFDQSVPVCWSCCAAQCRDSRKVGRFMRHNVARFIAGIASLPARSPYCGQVGTCATYF